MHKIHLDFKFPCWVVINCEFDIAQRLKTFIGCQYQMKDKFWRFHICYLPIFIKSVYKEVLDVSLTYSDLLNSEFEKYQNDIKRLENLKSINYDVDNYKTYFKQNNNYKLTNTQLQGANWLANVKRGILSFDVGVGKTFTTLEAASIVNNNGKKKIIIITLASLISQWKSEIESQYDIECFSVKEFKKQKLNQFGEVVSEKIVTPDTEERKILYKQFANNNKFSALIINYELVRIDFKELKELHFDIAIIDEASKLKSTNSFNVTNKVRRLNNRASVRELLKDTEYIFGATATPFENVVSDLYGIFNVINPDYFSGGYTRFVNRYMKQDRFGGWTIINKENFDEIKDLVKPYMFFKKQELDVKVNIHKIELNFSDRDISLYNQIIDDTKIEISKSVHKRSNESFEDFDKRFDEALMMSVTNKRMQFVDFPQIVYPNEYQKDYISPKAKWLLDNINNFEGKTVIFDSRTMTTNLLCEIFNKYNIKYYIIDGEINLKNRTVILNRFKNEDDVKILICSDCLNMGVNLQFVSNLINFNLLWNPSAMQQRGGRIIRKGQVGDVNIYFLEIKNTFEENVYKKLDYRSQIASDIFDDNFLKNKRKHISKNKMFEMMMEKGH